MALTYMAPTAFQAKVSAGWQRGRIAMNEAQCAEWAVGFMTEQGHTGGWVHTWASHGGPGTPRFPQARGLSWMDLHASPPFPATPFPLSAV